MAVANVLLLLEFADGMQEWAAAVARGAAAVAALERAFGQLEQEQAVVQEASDVHKRLLELAPSFRLEAYVQRGRAGLPSSAAAVGPQLHAALTRARQAVQDAAGALGGLANASKLYQEQTLSAQLSGAAMLAPADAAAAAPAHQQRQEEAAGGAGAGASDPSTPSCTLEQALQPEEVAVLMDCVVAGLQRELQWMEAVVDGVSLETTAEELAAAAVFWELQPFTNEAAAAAVLDAAQAAAAAAGDEAGADAEE